MLYEDNFHENFKLKYIRKHLHRDFLIYTFKFYMSKADRVVVQRSNKIEKGGKAFYNTKFRLQEDLSRIIKEQEFINHRRTKKNHKC